MCNEELQDNWIACPFCGMLRVEFNGEKKGSQVSNKPEESDYEFTTLILRMHPTASSNAINSIKKMITKHGPASSNCEQCARLKSGTCEIHRFTCICGAKFNYRSKYRTHLKAAAIINMKSWSQ